MALSTFSLTLVLWFGGFCGGGGVKISLSPTRLEDRVFILFLIASTVLYHTVFRVVSMDYILRFHFFFYSTRICVTVGIQWLIV